MKARSRWTELSYVMYEPNPYEEPCRECRRPPLHPASRDEKHRSGRPRQRDAHQKVERGNGPEGEGDGGREQAEKRDRRVRGEVHSRGNIDVIGEEGVVPVQERERRPGEKPDHLHRVPRARSRRARQLAGVQGQDRPVSDDGKHRVTGHRKHGRNDPSPHRLPVARRPHWHVVPSEPSLRAPPPTARSIDALELEDNGSDEPDGGRGICSSSLSGVGVRTGLLVVFGRPRCARMVVLCLDGLLSRYGRV